MTLMNPKIIRKKGVEQLKCFLNEREQREKGKEIAEAFSRKAGHERELESFKKTAGGKIKVEEGNIQRLQEVIISGYEYRHVEVETEYNYDDAIVEKVRLDTSEIFEARPMTSGERQTIIRFQDTPESPPPEPVQEDEEEVIEEEFDPTGTLAPDDLEPGV